MPGWQSLATCDRDARDAACLFPTTMAKSYRLRFDDRSTRGVPAASGAFAPVGNGSENQCENLVNEMTTDLARGLSDRLYPV